MTNRRRAIEQISAAKKRPARVAADRVRKKGPMRQQAHRARPKTL